MLLNGTIEYMEPNTQRGRGVADRSEVVAFCDELLRAGVYTDGAVNGLQVQGSATISRLAVAVSTSLRTLEAAIEWDADGLLVHHGLLYGSQMRPLTGLLAHRLRLLFKNDINLIGYHLPLDGHETIGNSAQFADATGCTLVDRFAYIGGQPLGVVGEPETLLTLSGLVERVAQVTDRPPVVLPVLQDDVPITRAGFLTGSGYSTLEDAVAAHCQVLVTGDVREPTMAEARELGISVIVAGHEASERLGVQALAAKLASEFDIETRYFHDPNPV